MVKVKLQINSTDKSTILNLSFVDGDIKAIFCCRAKNNEKHKFKEE